MSDIDIGAPYRVVIDTVHPGWGSHGPTKQVVLQFGNGYGVSIIQGGLSYGTRDDGLCEVAVVRFQMESDDYDVTMDTPVADDVFGWQTQEQVRQIATAVASLPAAYKALPEET